MNKIDARTLRLLGGWLASPGSVRPTSTGRLIADLAVAPADAQSFAESIRRLVRSGLVDANDVTSQSSPHPEYLILGLSLTGQDAAEGPANEDLAHLEPISLTEAQQIALDTVYGELLKADSWPSYKFVAKMIDLRTDEDPDEVLRSMPAELLIFNIYSPQSSEVKLTIAGLRYCSDPTARDALVFFLRCVQWFAERQKRHVPSSSQDADDPHATGIEATRALSANGVGPGPGHARRLFWFIEQDDNLWGGGSRPTIDHDWDVVIPERARVYRGVTSIDDYLERYKKSMAPKPRQRVFVDPNLEESNVVPPRATSAIFLVHGHDEGPKYQVAHFLSKATGIQPIILDEQASSGKTLIEKFEHHAAGAVYAVVLLTADDLGRAKDEQDLKPRARQNVVFELGYFFAHLTRRNVAVLLDIGVEKPTDIEGLVYIKRDQDGGWKTKLAKELNEAGISADPTKG